MEMTNIYQAIAGIMRKGAVIGKDKKNQKQNFNYRGIDDVMNVFQPLLAEAGIFLVPEVLEAHREERKTSNGGNLIYSVLRVKYTFYAEDGSSVSATVIGEGMDSGDKASNKAMAVAMKYAMFQVFCIPTEEMKDPDAETPPPSRPEPKVQEEQKEQEEIGPKLADDGNYYCYECKQPIAQVTLTSGQKLTPKEIVSMSWQAYNTQLCFRCAKKRKAA